MQSGTPFWSLSSTAVAPRRIRSLSILSVTSSINISRSALTEFLASLNSLLKTLYSSSLSSRYASINVLRPASAYSFT
uniref:Phospholipid-transporting ATPase n=1 Tax=Rhizophora mucronata TaxID=61149 RepID=A0A2P2MIG9_RHIMU